MHMPIAVTRSGEGLQMKKLTIGMPVYDDFDGVYFTIQSLRLFHPEVQHRIQYVIVDNHPQSSHGEACQRLAKWIVCEGRSQCTYVAYGAVRGTSQAKNQVFRHAETDYVMCIDCHVLFVPGAMKRLIEYFDEHPDTPDLLHGVLLYDDLETISTHFAHTEDNGQPLWSEGMLGQWDTDERGLDPNAEPFEIPMQGMGVFACTRETWPGFNKHFLGFGGEEGYIHEKIRRSGGKCLCLPFLRWVHRFARPNGIPYPNIWEERIRNYVIGHRENGLDEEPIKEHFYQIIGKEKVDKLMNHLSDFDPLI